MDGWTTETASLATLTRPLTLVSGLKNVLLFPGRVARQSIYSLEITNPKFDLIFIEITKIRRNLSMMAYYKYLAKLFSFQHLGF